VTGIVRIELDVVEASAKQIQGLLDDLEAPAARLEAAVRQIRPSVYGTDALGRALSGSSSSVGGLADHQQQVLQGIRQFLQNSAKLADNLQTVCRNHRATDEQQATALQAITGVSATPVTGTVQAVPASMTTARTAPVVNAPASSPPAPDPAEPLYQTPAAPTLEYNHPRPDPQSHAGPGGGRQLI